MSIIFVDSNEDSEPVLISAVVDGDGDCSFRLNDVAVAYICSESGKLVLRQVDPCDQIPGVCYDKSGKIQISPS